MAKTLNVTKREAVRRQVETAIVLWFSDGDPVSIHTLAGAADIIINDLVKDDTSIVTLEKSIKPEFRKKVRTAHRKARNFFKHADNDGGDSLDFKDLWNLHLIANVVMIYRDFTGNLTPIMGGFWRHFSIHHPQYFPAVPVQAAAAAEHLRQLSKQEFFEAYCSTAAITAPLRLS